ncbi:MAG: hypothetical protein GWN77_12040, partial [Gammaproteobacteria bacterium]|nr:hypothetical protein [Gammaproteobacteria bacterium]
MSAILTFRKVLTNAMDAHVMLAELAGKNIDNIIKRNVARLQDLSLPGIIDLNEEQWEYEFNALRSAFEHSIFTDGVFIADLDGNVLMTYPHLDDGEMNLLALPYMDEAISEDRTVVSNVYTDERTGRKVIYVLVPKKNDKG